MKMRTGFSKFRRHTLILLIFTAVTTACGDGSNGQDYDGVQSEVKTEDESETGNQTEFDIESGWDWSYIAGTNDINDKRVGGSEILHIVGYKGALYTINGYWQDTANFFYGGQNYETPWAQVLRLDAPDDQWEVDLEMGPAYVRGEILKSVTFTTDGEGNILNPPVDLLMASAWTLDLGNYTFEATVFIRNDAIGTWDKQTIYADTYTGEGNECSMRDIQVYRDKETDIDRIFIVVGIFGIFSGVYDPDAPTGIRWDEQPETGGFDTRPLAIIEANDAILFSAGKRLYRRNDGEYPTYTIVHDMGDLYPEDVFPGNGGIRGITAIPNPNGAGESLLFAWEDCIYRLDPDGNGGYMRKKESCLIDHMADYLGEDNSVVFLLMAYNDLLPVTDPDNQETVHLIGFEAVINKMPYVLSNANGRGFYPGAMYAIRDKNGNYRLKEVNGRWENGNKPVLVSTRAYALSPFEGADSDAVYFGGYDCNYQPTHDSAWIFSASLETVLSRGE